MDKKLSLIIEDLEIKLIMIQGNSRKKFWRSRLRCVQRDRYVDSVYTVTNSWDDISRTLFVNSPVQYYTYYIDNYLLLSILLSGTWSQKMRARLNPAAFLYQPSGMPPTVVNPAVGPRHLTMTTQFDIFSRDKTKSLWICCIHHTISDEIMQRRIQQNSWKSVIVLKKGLLNVFVLPKLC